MCQVYVLYLSPVQYTDSLSKTVARVSSSLHPKVKWFFSWKVWDQIDTSHAKGSTLGYWLLVLQNHVCFPGFNRVVSLAKSAPNWLHEVDATHDTTHKPELWGSELYFSIFIHTKSLRLCTYLCYLQEVFERI